jgi:hypothetical protein
MAKRNRRTVAELLAALEASLADSEQKFMARKEKIEGRIVHLRTKFRKAALAAELLADKSADEVLSSIDEQMAALREQRSAIKAAAR